MCHVFVLFGQHIVPGGTPCPHCGLSRSPTRLSHLTETDAGSPRWTDSGDFGLPGELGGRNGLPLRMAISQYFSHFRWGEEYWNGQAVGLVRVAVFFSQLKHCE